MLNERPMNVSWVLLNGDGFGTLSDPLTSGPG
jgi:hypothetical protein